VVWLCVLICDSGDFFSEAAFVPDVRRSQWGLGLQGATGTGEQLFIADVALRLIEQVGSEVRKL
jgi:hypothetical protein